MPNQSVSELSHFLLTVGVLLSTARFFGEIARRFNLPAVLGEILAGIVLGPTVFGTISPEWYTVLFPSSGGARHALDAFTTLSVVLFLMVSGMEIELSTVFRQGTSALIIGAASMVVPFGIAFITALVFPDLVGFEQEVSLPLFAAFFATALSVSALPVISRILMDLDLHRSDMGVLSLAVAALNDLCGWIILGVIFGVIGVPGSGKLPLGNVIALTIAFAVFVLTVGRWLVDRLLPWLQAYTSWPGSVLSASIAAALFAGAFTEWLGIHAVMGAFLVGIAIGESRHLRRQTRVIISDFVSYFFAPLFFASIGLRINFVEGFDLKVVVTIFIIAGIGKVFGAGLAARATGLPARESFAMGFMLNARGAMEVIVGTLALEYGLIHARTYEALVIMAIATSLLASTTVQYFITRKTSKNIAAFVHPSLFRSPLAAQTAYEAIQELSALASSEAKLDSRVIQEAVWKRECIMATGLENGVAVPHARLDNLEKAVVAIGISPQGIDFDAPDGSRAHVVILFLTPAQDEGIQLDLLADVAKRFAKPLSEEQITAMKTFTEFLAFIRLGPEESL
ncbi:MAG TPA: cation:proton antiporter [Candidatus Hydrogenedentes bacterium]|nr:cation:proton antiporter [Candidatus Hydrogenedentota bacterium]HOL76155.1 cation:proton antiporter [Candidatus Hydrogenedentota bacterium]HPO84770.1 cation:proton antiporter [Candidatus Hydrogenedentota bacterium]